MVKSITLQNPQTDLVRRRGALRIKISSNFKLDWICYLKRLIPQFQDSGKILDQNNIFLKNDFMPNFSNYIRNFALLFKKLRGRGKTF